MNETLRTLRWSAWLGWLTESNWTDPFRFTIYLLLKPLCGSLLLVSMCWAAQAATGGLIRPGFLPFVYVSNACYLLVGAVTFGMSWAVITDREHYGMLKYVCLSPARLQTYLIGRGVARGASGGLGGVLTLILGWLLLPELRAVLGGEGIGWGWLLFYLLFGLVMLVALGLLVAGAVLHMARHGMFLSEGIAGMLYLLSGAVFPLDVLPGWVQPISLALPPTLWLEGVRRALLGREAVASISTVLAGWDDVRLALTFAGGTVVLAVVAQLFFRWSERRAWRLGKFDETSGY